MGIPLCSQATTSEDQYSIRLEKYRGEAPPDWDRFVERCDPPHFEQSSSWARVEEEDGWLPGYVIVRDDTSIQAGAQVLTRAAGWLGRVGYVVRGPLQLPQGDRAEDTIDAICRGLCAYARQERLSLLVVSPPFRGHAAAAVMKRSFGFANHPNNLPPAHLPDGVLLIDVARPYFEVRKDIRRTTRQEIARGIRSGIKVCERAAEGLDVFWSLHQSLCRRRGVASNVPGLPYVRKLWAEFQTRSMARLFTAEVDDKPVAALICITSGAWFHAWRIGWSGEVPASHPAKVLLAHAIETAAREGYSFFDLGGLDIELARRIEAGGCCSIVRDAGITLYKLGFGGAIQELPPTVDFVPNPVLRQVYRFGGSRLLRSSSVTRLLDALGARR